MLKWHEKNSKEKSIEITSWGHRVAMVCIIPIIKGGTRGAHPGLDRTSGLPPSARAVVVRQRGHRRRRAVDDGDIPASVLLAEAQELLESPHCTSRRPRRAGDPTPRAARSLRRRALLGALLALLPQKNGVCF